MTLKQSQQIPSPLSLGTSILNAITKPPKCMGIQSNTNPYHILYSL